MFPDRLSGQVAHGKTRSTNVRFGSWPCGTHSSALPRTADVIGPGGQASRRHRRIAARSLRPRLRGHGRGVGADKLGEARVLAARERVDQMALDLADEA